MIFFFDAKGNLTRALPETIKQGSNRSSRLWFFMPTAPTNIVNAYIVLPNGEHVEPLIMTSIGIIPIKPNVDYDIETYSAWFCDIPKRITKYAGTLEMSFEIASPDDANDEDENETTESVQIVVSKGVFKPLNIEKTYTYAQLMSYVASIQAYIENVLNDLLSDFSIYQEKTENELNKKLDADKVNFINGDGLYSLVQKTGENGSHGSSNTTPKNQSTAKGKNAVAFGVQGESAGDCTLTAGYQAKALEKSCIAFGTGIAGRTSQEWINYYWDVENWKSKHWDGIGNVEEIVGEIPSDWQNKGIVEKDGKYYYVLGHSGSKYGSWLLNPSFAEGQGTKAKGMWSHAQGYDTIADADFADVSGQGSKSHGHHGHAGGWYAENNAPYGFAHGFNVVTSPNRTTQTVFGHWNEVNDEALLQIGNGRDSITRSNAFEVLEDGRAKVYGAPKDENDVVRRKELLSSIANIDKLTYKVVATLPTTGEDNIIYLVPNTNSQDKNIKDEYLWIDGKWELIGSTAIDLTEYQKKTDDTLETESKEIVGAINEVNLKVGQGGGSSLDVQINGTSIVENGVANIPLDTKLDKPTATTLSVVLIDKDGKTASRGITNSPTKGLIPVYGDPSTTGGTDGGGCLSTATPTNSYHCANKKYVDYRFNGAQNAVVFADYASMIQELNIADNGAYTIGQNVYIRTLNVPDLWISSILTLWKEPYTYVSDEDFINELKENGTVTIGHYRVSALETQKVDLTEYKTKDVQINGISIVSDGVANIPIWEVGGVMYSVGNGFGLVPANSTEIANRNPSRKPVTMENMDLAFRECLVNNKGTLTAEEKANAQKWLGATKLYKYTLDYVGEDMNQILILISPDDNLSIRRIYSTLGDMFLCINTTDKSGIPRVPTIVAAMIEPFLPQAGFSTTSNVLPLYTAGVSVDFDTYETNYEFIGISGFRFFMTYLEDDIDLSFNNGAFVTMRLNAMMPYYANDENYWFNEDGTEKVNIKPLYRMEV